MMIRTGRAFLAATAVVLALTVTGCGTKHVDGDAAPTASGTAKGGTSPVELAPAALLAQVGEKTGAAKSAKVQTWMMLGKTNISMKGALSWEHGMQGELTGDMGGAFSQQLIAAGGDGTLTIRYLHDAMYIDMGKALTAQLGGAHWVKYDYANLTKTMGASGDSVKKQIQGADPVASVRALIASGKAAKAGTEDIDGKPTTMYTANLTLDDLAKATSRGLTPEQADELRQQYSAGGVTTDHIEVWVGEDGLLAKKIEQFETKAGVVSSTAVYSDYGTPVNTTAPSATETIDFVDLLKTAKNSATPKS
ncbi:hypothetical protein [Kitasatospora sp. NPDC088134]|uniref:hypothetical protein n=1 Tax=Kitasatospora sp. NPDC088134 TaxID=3364071 RepID=UPI003806C3FC